MLIKEDTAVKAVSSFINIRLNLLEYRIASGDVFRQIINIRQGAEHIPYGGMKMEVVFEYEFDGIVYPEDNPPPKLINDLLDALEPFLLPTLNLNQAE